MGRWIVSVAVAACAWSSGGSAQDTHAAHTSVVVPMELLARPVMVRSGIGSVHHPVTTSSPQAQRFYDQGLAYLHNFAWIEAARAFNEALRLDSRLALAYVGLSIAYVELSQPAAAQ